MITDTLKTAVANHIVAALTVWGYHWNVEGKDFNVFHELFGELYKDYFEHTDILAEHIRSISGSAEYVNPGIDVVKQNTTIKDDFMVGNKTKEMVLAVIELNNKILDDLSAIFDEATKENQQGLVDYVTSRINTINTKNWMLTAIAKD